MDNKPPTTPNSTPPTPSSANNTNPVVVIQTSSSNIGGKILQLIGVISLVAVFGGVAFYLGSQGSKPSTILPNKSADNQPSASQSPTNSPSVALPSTKVTNTALFTGQLKRLSQNLLIFKTTEADKLNNVVNDFIYYEAGVFTRGDLKDFTRVVAIRPSEGMGSPQVFVLATKDYKTYILNDPKNATTKYPADDWQNPYSLIDQSKIESTLTFDTEHSLAIDLDSNYSLYTVEYATETIKTNAKDSNNYDIYETGLLVNFSTYQKLLSKEANLTYYFRPNQNNNEYGNQMNANEKEKVQLRQKYILGSTEIIVTDSAGLPMSYSLTTPTNIKEYDTKVKSYEVEMKNFQDQLTQYQDKKIAEYPKYPDFLYLPNLGTKSSQINSSKPELKFYSNYQTAFPGACATTLNTAIIDIDDADLEQIGNLANLPVYKLKDANHPLYNLAYKNKMDYYDLDPTSWDQMNKNIKKPTLGEYINNTPLLFTKDHWQRWVAIGEYDIMLPGGCGKPVIYLYPQTPTNVSVKFDAPVQFTVDMPKYVGNWQVKAYPNGDLVNLKPELTDCRLIDSTKKGMEYAKLACQNNTYPYLYWAGSIQSRNYPVIDKGWIVSQSELSSFMLSKLSDMGLNAKETSDFMEYWLPDMLTKNTPYYRIAFLQTSDLNLLFPMTVSPRPDTTFRIFLDYLPLTHKPTTLPAPQYLDKLQRVGFTLVEWGGLKQP